MFYGIIPSNPVGCWGGVRQAESLAIHFRGRCDFVRAKITERRASSLGESPMQRNREDGFSDSTDPWAHGQRPSTPFPLQ